jgi:phosphohistidine swiveling domain-containing protein
MSGYIFHPKRNLKASRFGAKASNLNWLIQHGFPVPESVFIRVDAYHNFMQINHLRSLAATLQQTLKKKRKIQAEETGRRLMNKIRQGRLPEDLHRELQIHCSQFGGQLIAARSSALAEDLSAHSFAGQYDTILNISPQPDMVADAIKQVWSSQFNERFIAYSMGDAGSIPQFGMGIILQRMIPAKYAGVIFTEDPADKSGGNSLIEYVEGCGEGLVSGEKTPVRFKFSRTTQEYITNPPPDAVFTELMKLALRIEKCAGRPADIEWAIDAKDKVSILQYRPITGASVTADDEILWTNENVGEVIPDVVTPYTWSVLGPVANGAFEKFLRSIGLGRYPENGLFALYHGKVYFNNTAFNLTLQRFYVGEHLRNFKQTGGALKSLKQLLLAAWSLGNAAILALFLHARINRYLRKYPRQLEEVKYVAPQPVEECLNRTRRIIDLHKASMSLHVACAIYGEVYYQLTVKFCREWLPPTEEDIAGKLLAGSNDAESARSGLALREIARSVEPGSNVYRVLLETPPDVIEQQLQTTEDGRKILEQVAFFLEEFGHGALHEFELSYPRWWEDRSYIYSMLKSYLSDETRYDLVDRMKEQSREQERLTRTVLWKINGLKNIPKRIIFSRVLRRAKLAFRQRENLKQAINRAHSELKKHLLKLGDALQNRKCLAEIPDIFFLTQDEIMKLVSGPDCASELQGKIAARKTIRNEDLRFMHPDKVKQHGESWLTADEISGDSAETLQGIGCSAGIVSGRARIIPDAGKAGQFLKGEILITRSTNPGWTPLFILAAGVITEIGGALSHGAIVAREYGIPMITAVKNVTMLLHDGDLIRMDGRSGRIERI